jgi:hypothetical protein
MLAEALIALAASAGSRLVTAMVDDGWAEVKTRVARLLGRGDPAEEERQEGRLERAREEVVAGTGEDLDRVRQHQSAAWSTRFADLLEENPHAEMSLRELDEFLQRLVVAPTAGVVQVNASASDQAQQAVQGQGVQTNTFNPPGPSSR